MVFDKCIYLITGFLNNISSACIPPIPTGERSHNIQPSSFDHWEAGTE